MARFERGLFIAVLVLSAGAMPRLARAQMGPGGMGGGPSPAQKSAPQGDILPDVDEKIANDPDKVFEHAEKSFKSRDWLEAIAYYRRLRVISQGRPSLSSQAELRLGDIAFERERWPEATAYYKEFLTLHPRDAKVDYVQYRLGMAAFKDIPSDLFIEPPSYERDQSEVHIALDLMLKLVKAHPDSTYIPDANKVIVKCQDKLAMHELYVARFYESRMKWGGVASRSEGLAQEYAASTLVPEALALAIHARVKLDDVEAARQDMERLVAMNPPQGVLKSARAELAAARH
jgi:outer membrane protein assembly factor BamD